MTKGSIRGMSMMRIVKMSENDGIRHDARDVALRMLLFLRMELGYWRPNAGLPCCYRVLPRHISFPHYCYI